MVHHDAGAIRCDVFWHARAALDDDPAWLMAANAGLAITAEAESGRHCRAATW